MVFYIKEVVLAMQIRTFEEIRAGFVLTNFGAHRVAPGQHCRTPGVGLLPLRADEVFLLQLVEYRIYGTLLPGEEALPFAVDAADEGVAVGGFSGENRENQEPGTGPDEFFRTNTRRAAMLRRHAPAMYFGVLEAGASVFAGDTKGA